MEKPEEGSVTPKPATGWQISKKMAAFIAIVFVGSCIGVGLVVHYVGRPNKGQCELSNQISGSTLKPEKDIPPTELLTVRHWFLRLKKIPGKQFRKAAMIF
jgi:hypothetical protein